MSESKYVNSSLEKSLRVLELFNLETQHLSLSEIARCIGATPGGLYPIVQTLLNHGFLEKDLDSKHYRLGLAILERANYVLSSLDVRERAKPVLKSLASELQVNAHLAVRYEDEVLYLDREEASSGVVFPSIIGRRVPLHCTALGKAFLASDPTAREEDIAKLDLLQITPKTITTPMRLRAELEKVYRQGYAIDDEEFHLGQLCIAAPVTDYQGRVVAAISISLTKARLETEPLKGFIDEIVRGGASLSRSIGYTG